MTDEEEENGPPIKGEADADTQLCGFLRVVLLHVFSIALLVKMKG